MKCPGGGGDRGCAGRTQRRWEAEAQEECVADACGILEARHGGAGGDRGAVVWQRRGGEQHRLRWLWQRRRGAWR